MTTLPQPDTSQPTGSAHGSLILPSARMFTVDGSPSLIPSMKQSKANVCPTKTSTNHDKFEYELLNHNESSIRLLQILPNISSQGYIQCSLQHATINAEYTCLSYVWGHLEKGSVILVNGKEHEVRQNLYDFLQVARTRHSSKLLWIDALCINQDDFIERNHQVQQMGPIYLNAKEVLAWLGNDEAIEDQLMAIDSYGTPPWKYLEYAGWRLLNSNYWSRAWITQEVALARQLIVCAGQAEIDIQRLWSVYKYSGLVHNMTYNMRTTIESATNLERLSLIQLLFRYHSKQCHIARDRIYSLLAICSEGAGLDVDYKASDEDLLQQMM